MKLFLVLLMVMGLVSCSMNKGNETETLDGIENASEGFSDGGDAELMGLLDEEVLGDQADIQDKASEKMEDFITEETGNSFQENVDEVKREVAAMPISINEDGEFQVYEVKKNETLMWIAFKLYGDYRKWKELANWNGTHFASGALRAGTEIKYKSSSFVWRPKGNPYLIERGDYLSKISKKVYGTPMEWKRIWENNRPMIRYPDLIFAGFTLYYVPKEEWGFQKKILWPSCQRLGIVTPYLYLSGKDLPKTSQPF